jgi:hypothetical protein
MTSFNAPSELLKWPDVQMTAMPGQRYSSQLQVDHRACR